MEGFYLLNLTIAILSILAAFRDKPNVLICLRTLFFIRLLLAALIDTGEVQSHRGAEW